MTVDPDDIRLNDEQRKQLAERAEMTGKPWRQLLREALASVLPRRATLTEQTQDELPRWPGQTIGMLSRDDIYGDRN